jgi:hypothetical protein
MNDNLMMMVVVVVVIVFLSTPMYQIFFGILIKGCFAAWGAKIVGLSLML